MARFNTDHPHCHQARAGVRSSLATSNWQLATTRAFTLIELLIVLAIIGAVVALGVPLFGVLTGSRSVEAGRNVVAATLGQARTVAVNEGKYAGVMFYVDPATERTAMSIVIVTDPASSQEDPDPYDKYKSWLPDNTYYSGKLDLNGLKTPPRSDRAIGFAADADAAYRSSIYDPAGSPKPPVASDYLTLFGNYRPAVRTFRCIQSIADSDSSDQNGSRPPRNGPYVDATNSKIYTRPGSTTGSNYPLPLESTRGAFSNGVWGIDNQTEVTRYTTGEQTLLPRGVGVQLMIQAVSVPVVATPVNAPTERYVRTGVIMFDPQGRLVLRNFSLSYDGTLGQYLLMDKPGATNPRALQTVQIVAGVGLTLYDTTLFKAGGFTEGDALYQPLIGSPYSLSAKVNPALSDYATPAAEITGSTGVVSEEQWLDANGTPLVINRYTGSLSDAQ